MKRLKYIFTVFVALLVFVPSPVYAVSPGQISGKQAQWFCESFVALTGYAIPDYDSSKPNSQQYQVFMDFYGDCYRWCADNAVDFGNPVSNHINFNGNGADYLAATVSANHTLIKHNIYGLFDVPDWVVEQLKRYAESRSKEVIDNESDDSHILPAGVFEYDGSNTSFVYDGKTYYFSRNSVSKSGLYSLIYSGYAFDISGYWKNYMCYYPNDAYLLGYLVHDTQNSQYSDLSLLILEKRSSDSPGGLDYIKYQTQEKALEIYKSKNLDYGYGLPSGITVTIDASGNFICSDPDYKVMQMYIVDIVGFVVKNIKHLRGNDTYLVPLVTGVSFQKADNSPDVINYNYYFKSAGDNQNINNYYNVVYNIDNSVTNNYQQLPDDSTSDFLPWVKNIAENLYNLSTNFNNWTIQLGRMLNLWFEGVYSRLEKIYAALLDSQVLPDVPKDADITRLKDSINDFQKVAYKYFPFSVPWDMYTMISFFSAPPEAPKFDVPYINSDYTVGKYHIDLTPFDDAAKTARAGMRVVFDFGLLLLFKKLSDDTPIG